MANKSRRLAWRRTQTDELCVVQRSAASTAALWQTNPDVWHCDTLKPWAFALCSGRPPRPLRYGKQIQTFSMVTNSNRRALRCAAVDRPDRCAMANKSNRLPPRQSTSADRLPPRGIVAKVEMGKPQPVRHAHADQGYGTAHLGTGRAPEVPNACGHGGFAVVALDNVIQP